jgi:sugar O-acyltransferase (sialic acid O-acetyltransferase NeuD family)
MITERLLIVGAGGQAKVVIEALRADNNHREVMLVDEDERKCGLMVSGCKVTAGLASALSVASEFHVTVGSNVVRERISMYLMRQGLPNYLSIFHTRAYLSSSASIDDGVFVAAQAIVGPDTRIERGCIINHGAVVDHDCVVAEFSHIAPNATLGGNVKVGRRALIGAGANILPGVTVGDDCVVGAGSVVLNDLDQGGVYVGVPARKYK